MGSVSMANSLKGMRSSRNSLSAPGAPTVAVVAVVLGLVMLGLVMIYSASYARAYEQSGDSNYYLKRQLFAAMLGFPLLLVCARLDYRRWMTVDGWFLAACVALLVATLIPGVAVGYLWMRLGPFNFQPTEFLKLALIVYLAASLTRRQERVREFSQGLWPHLTVMGAITLLTIKQPDFGMAMMFVSITYCLLFAGGAALKHLGATLLAALPPLALLMVAAPYRLARLFSFLDPFADAQQGGYQIIQSLVSLGSGGLWGRGLGAGVEKLGYLPAAHTDFIFSVLGEELGLWGTGLVLAGFVCLGWLGVRVALNAPDRFGMLLAAGVTFSLCFQAFLNLGVAVGALPVTGLTLPFVSYGGSSLLVSLIMVGVLLSVSRGSGHDQRAGLRRR